MTEASLSPQITVIGGGSIGVAFAVLFARAGNAVRVYEPDAQRQQAVPLEVGTRLADLHSYDLLTEPADAIADRVRVHASLSDAVADADLVQECVPEDVQIKRTLFSSLAELTRAECIIASSTSFIPSSTSAEQTGVEERTLVAHPGNPPYAIPVIELVPNPQTRPEIVQRAEKIYRQAGMSPVRVRQEVEGFVFNRLQGAILREAYALVRDGVASVEDIDTVVRDGLGRRWAFMGPFETVDLNTRGGIAAHAQKMGPFYERMGRERGDTSSWDPELVGRVEAQRRELLDLQDWEDRVAWRDQQLLTRLQFAAHHTSKENS
ncbi:3-hydroxyacyl-CoA dehydrogenase [Citricoccus sp. NR2]|uniref:3-hydroxyacyl-CoA dehydrogenase n=1 Tax=Citricoccus sp. NR2 TaxID=3004095 RepID=UPI0022DE04AD|nr:3-hydroxyacyl-CoA dehydrogenase [Citricoccus sp. NR2]WBL19484.1 3-hydroxyacyl-CoA dehydrogenase [Citricoccus sp. NR2]